MRKEGEEECGDRPRFGKRERKSVERGLIAVSTYRAFRHASGLNGVVINKSPLPKKGTQVIIIRCFTRQLS
jgi:hypothetical protein